MDPHPHTISLQASAKFDSACRILATLIGYASSRAVADTHWAALLDEWTQRLTTLNPRDDHAVAYVLAADAAVLKALGRR
ncbi:hypothetical protein [Nocardia sp. XZ_19_369]|uniref:hypothetical protein n=1 Tax=Nocardia sp. XZ_19_369 TaxID=2769487 RepID=UPI00188E33CA|nr:hypothetical protein [Nocardia sp. XZ_19_369]